MKLESTNLEKKLFSTPLTNFAWGALVASGSQNQKEIASYLAKINTLGQYFEVACIVINDRQKAKVLFDWFWESKPNRYEYQGSFMLTETLDAQLSPRTEKVGNCLGLTVLYNALAQRLGLDTKTVYLEEAFGRESHVFSTLETNQVSIDIENVFPHGFDFKEHLGSPQRIQWGDAELIADIYHSTGNEFFLQGELENAIQSYGKAIQLNPNYTKAYLNRGIALSMLGRDTEAEQDFDLS